MCVCASECCLKWGREKNDFQHLRVNHKRIYLYAYIPVVMLKKWKRNQNALNQQLITVQTSVLLLLLFLFGFSSSSSSSAFRFNVLPLCVQFFSFVHDDFARYLFLSHNSAGAITAADDDDGSVWCHLSRTQISNTTFDLLIQLKSNKGNTHTLERKWNKRIKKKKIMSLLPNG